jgi:Rps23 Pro-64 3,4-dihydroxylase Tpa1-like proline 4-hydroxylase
MELDVVDDPFPHAVVDGYWNPELLSAVLEEIGLIDVGLCRRYFNERENKYDAGKHLFGPHTRILFEYIRTLTPILGKAFGIPNLSMEENSGCHLIPPGGFLAVHTDWNRSQATGLYRRLNVLVYLNEGWTDEGGCLHLEGVDPPQEIRFTPEFNRTVVLEASDRAWHGHPLPAQRWRFSAAGYFSSPEPPPGYSREHDTEWLR